MNCGPLPVPQQDSPPLSPPSDVGEHITMDVHYSLVVNVSFIKESLVTNMANASLVAGKILMLSK